MRLMAKKREAGELEFGIIYGTIALVAVGIAKALPLEKLAPSCLFRSLTGVPCPTCGITRALMHFSRGEMAMALLQNPLFLLLLMLTLLYGVVNSTAVLLRLPRVVVLLTPFERNLLITAAGAVIAANWTYLIAQS
jgi:hypothetical protein